MFKQKEPTTVQILSNESNKLKYFLLWNSGWEKWEKRRKKSTVRKVFFIEGVLKREEEVKGGSIVRSQGVGFTELYRQVRITETGKITEAGKDYSDRERLQRHERITQIGKESMPQLGHYMCYPIFITEVCQIFCQLFHIAKVSPYGGRRDLSLN